MAASTQPRDVGPTPTAVAVNTGHLERVSWGAVFAGLVCAVALQALFTLVGLAWGFAVIDPAEEVNPFAGLLTGGGIYWAITGVASMFAGGWIAGRVSGIAFMPASAVHGLCVWALATIIALASGAGILTGAASTATNAAGSVVQATVSAAQTTGAQLAAGVEPDLTRRLQEAMRQRDMTAADIRAELREMYRSVISPQEQDRTGDVAADTARDVLRTPGDFSSDISNGLDRMFGQDGPLGADDRQALNEALRNRFGLSEAEAERIIDRWQTRWNEATARLAQYYDRAAERVTEIADTAAEASATAFFWAGIISAVSLIAATFGGVLGRPDQTNVIA